MGAHAAYIYIRGEYVREREAVQRAAQAIQGVNVDMGLVMTKLQRFNSAVDAALAGVRRSIDAAKDLVQDDRKAQLAALDTQEESWN